MLERRVQRRLAGVERSLVWILGSPRTGSTWLVNLLAISDRVVPSDEPGIGYHLGMFAADVGGPHPAALDVSGALLPQARADDPNYFFSRTYEAAWREPLRRLILGRFAEQLSRAQRGSDPLLVIKEPAGSQAADFLLTLLPASKLLFLVRDGRDVVDSGLDAVDRGGWLAQLFLTEEEMSSDERFNLLRAQAYRWVHRMRTVGEVYERLPDDQRFLVRYEDLRADTTGGLGKLFRWLDVEVDPALMAQRVAAMSFEAQPREQTGTGKFARAGKSGGWRENLTSPEQRVIEDIMAETLMRLGYEA
jgi:hypothetical protein